jgi:hypothetical protein
MRIRRQERVIRIVGGLLLAVSLMISLWACTTESESGTGHWNGVARNTCGPADGAVLDFALRDRGRVECGDTGAFQARFSANGETVDSLRTGKQYQATQNGCSQGLCTSRFDYDLKILSSDGNAAHGTLEIREIGASGNQPPQTVEVDLIKCPERPLCL